MKGVRNHEKTSSKYEVDYNTITIKHHTYGYNQHNKYN